MSLPPFIKELDEKLEGLPDTLLSVILVSLGLFAIGVAIWGRPTLKALVAAWYLAP